MGLLYGENCMILTSNVFDWSTRVTDGQTDRQTDGIAIAYVRLQHMLSRAKTSNSNNKNNTVPQERKFWGGSGSAQPPPPLSLQPASDQLSTDTVDTVLINDLILVAVPVRISDTSGLSYRSLYNVHVQLSDSGGECSSCDVGAYGQMELYVVSILIILYSTPQLNLTLPSWLHWSINNTICVIYLSLKWRCPLLPQPIVTKIS